MVSGETILVVKEGLIEWTLGSHALEIWVFLVSTTDEFILVLDVLQAYDESWRHSWRR
jgi:hypothetical protein